MATSTGTTKYTLHGKNIVHMTGGSNNLHFFYDAQNKPAVVLFNGTAYAYLYNLQCDVIALVDANSSKVVEYKYDAWGNPLSKTGTLATTLGTLQPFREPLTLIETMNETIKYDNGRIITCFLLI